MSGGNEIQRLVALNVRSQRQAMGLSQEAFADRCGLHRTYIGAVERGERNITVNTLAKIATALGCPITDLLIKKGR